MRISVIILMLALLPLCFGAEQWSGTWSGTSAYGPVEGTWGGTVENGQIHGTVDAPDLGLSGSLSGTWNQGHISAGAVVGAGQQISWSGTISGNSASGQWSFPEYSAHGTWSGQTSYQPPPQTACGNDVAEGDGECNGTDLNGQTCISLGYDSGTLACNSDCTFDTSGCKNSQVPVTPTRPSNCCGSAALLLGVLALINRKT